MNLGRKMLAAVSDLECTDDDPAGEFLDGALAILNAALGNLPEARREAWLANIESGELRAAVRRFNAYYPPPYSTVH